MSRKPDAKPREPALSRFDHLPVLTAYTARDREGTHVIDACNGRFRTRLGWDRSAVLGRPLGRLYHDAGVPKPATGGAAEGEPRSDGGDSVPAAGSASDPDPAEVPAVDLRADDRYWRLRDRLRRLRRESSDELQTLGDERYQVAVGREE